MQEVLYKNIEVGGGKMSVTFGVEFAVALNNAQKKMGSAVKGAKNPYFKSKYADLNSVIEACKEVLNSEGISVLQPVVSDSSGDYVETVLIHTSGQHLASRTKLKMAKDNDMQAYGSAISYARRYGLQSMVLLPSSEDDDGEATMGRKELVPEAPKKEVKPATPEATFFKPSNKKPEWT